MSDESPEDASAGNDAPAHETEPADETEAVGETPPSGAEAADAQPASAEPPKRRGFYVPRWAAVVAAVVVAAVVLAGGGFAVGHYTAPSGDHDRREFPFERRLPGREGRDGRGEPRPTSGVFLGVSTRDATGGQQGAEIVNVLDGSPAAQAGLQAGDVVTAVDGSAVTSASELGQRVRNHEVGDQVTITYSRGGNSADAQVTLGNRSASARAS